MQQTGLTEVAIQELSIRWHPTTPRNFACQQGCVCCCQATLILPSEAEECPVEIQEALEWRQGFLRIQRRAPGVCAFFDENAPWHCGIPEHRPLRCRLYPYLPLITREAIVIVADPLSTVSFPTVESPAWYRCYGLGCGENVQSSVEQMSREFLERVMHEYPQLVETLIVDDVNRYLNPKEIEKNRFPLYSQWDTERIRQTIQSDMEAQHHDRVIQAD